jgi:hypothetical protein
MRGLDPRIHNESQYAKITNFRTMRIIMDCRVKPGNDRVEELIVPHVRVGLLYFAGGATVACWPLRLSASATKPDAFTSSTKARR